MQAGSKFLTSNAVLCMDRKSGVHKTLESAFLFSLVDVCSPRSFPSLLLLRFLHDLPLSVNFSEPGHSPSNSAGGPR